MTAEGTVEAPTCLPNKTLGERVGGVFFFSPKGWGPPLFRPISTYDQDLF
jgi:hypothetical protein